jgi:hypothetical protein
MRVTSSLEVDISWAAIIADGTVGEAVLKLFSKVVARSGKLLEESTIGTDIGLFLPAVEWLTVDAEDDWLGDGADCFLFTASL